MDKKNIASMLVASILRNEPYQYVLILDEKAIAYRTEPSIPCTKTKERKMENQQR
jgi:hypothetical protein